MTVFEGNDDAPRDNEAADIWKKYLPENRIYFLPAKNNWWSAGDNGPCGPDTEIFYDPNEIPIGDMIHDEFVKADDDGKVIEIWNNVFMQYEKKDGEVVGKLAKHNVDTGMGLERIAMVAQGVKTVFDTDLFMPIISKIEQLTGLQYGDKTDEEYLKTDNKCWVDTRKEIRIIADHIRTAVFMIGDGAIPSNMGAGYVLRRIIRRAVRFGDKIGMKEKDLLSISDIVIVNYGVAYPELVKNKNIITNEIEKEENKFRETLNKGLKEFEKGTDPFVLFTTYGFPVELTEELAKEKGIEIDKEDFNKKMQVHQSLSQTASAGMFKGGLANHSDKTLRLHTAHHLLLAGLQAVVDKNIKQKGSNITEERLRMDFLCDHKLTDEEKQKVEDWVNDKINKKLKMVRREMLLAEAEKIGAEMEFGAKYPEVVSVYFAEDEDGNVYSKEFCGGPHVENTGELGHFKIQKEEASSAGVRRIKAILI